MIQNRSYDDHGNDVTRLVGDALAGETQQLYDTFQQAHFEALNTPCVKNWRKCVEAYDAWEQQFTAQVQS